MTRVFVGAEVEHQGVTGEEWLMLVSKTLGWEGGAKSQPMRISVKSLYF